MKRICRRSNEKIRALYNVRATQQQRPNESGYDPIAKAAEFIREQKGAAAIELGLLGSLLFLLGIGLADFGIGYWEQIQVGNATRAGSEYAMVNGWSQSGISTAITGATGLASIEATPAPAKACGCPDSSAGISSATCGSSCPNGGTAGTYVTLHAQHAYPTHFNYPGIPNPFSLAATAIVRIK